MSNTSFDKKLLLLRVSDFGGTTNTTSTAGSNETDLTTGGSVTAYGGWETDMLMITTTVGMFNGVHTNTTNLRPAISLHLVLVVRSTRLQQRFVDTTATRYDTHTGTVERGDHLFDTGGKFDTGDVGIFVMSDHGGVTSRSTSQLSTVTGFLFHVADDRSFRHNAHREDVADLKGGFLSTVDELSRVHTFRSDEEFLAQFELVGVTERDDSKWGTSTRIVNNVLDHSLDVSITFSIVQRSQLGGSLPSFLVSSKHASCSLTLSSDHSSHYCCCCCCCCLA